MPLKLVRTVEAFWTWLQARRKAWLLANDPLEQHFARLFEGYADEALRVQREGRVRMCARRR